MPLIIGFTRQNSHVGSSCPKGNFEGDQLLDGSISLSPTNDLHISIAAGLHQSFLWLHPAQAQFTIFRVLTTILVKKNLPIVVALIAEDSFWSKRARRHTLGFSFSYYFIQNVPLFFFLFLFFFFILFVMMVSISLHH